MVLGYPCGRNYQISNSDILEAKRRINNDFIFIGLTEESETSYLLFKAMFSDGFLPSDYEVSRVRVNVKRHTEIDHNKLACDLIDNNWTDSSEFE
jgi:hypothetical protein